MEAQFISLESVRRRRAAARREDRRVFPRVYEHAPPALPENYGATGDGRAIRLQELDLYVTMRCNIRCHFCNVRAGEYNHRDLPLERILSLLDEARALGLEDELRLVACELCVVAPAAGA